MTFFGHWTFFFNTTQRIEILQYNSEDSTFFLWYDSKYWTFFVWLSELNLFSRNMTWLIELNLFLWTFFSRWLKELKSFFLTQRIEPSLFSNVTHRIEMFLLKMSQRIEPLFHVNFFVHDSKNLTFFSMWLKELNPVLNMINTQRIEPFIIWLKELSLFLIWRNALNFFLVCRKELSLILNMAQRIKLVFLK